MSVDGKKIIRVNNERASELYSEGFKYVPKTMWKDKVRDVETTTETKPTNKKSNEMSKAQKRHARKSIK